MKRIGIAAFVFLFCVALGRPAHATGRAECASLHSAILGRQVAYCAILPPSYDAQTTRRYPVLYFLHGLGENEQILITAGGLSLVEGMWEQKQIGEFLIVTPAAGSSFYINSRDGRTRYEDFIVRELLPFVEKHYRVRAGRASRGISGVSMGGYGALHLAFRRPELFGSVAAHSAALIEKLPANVGENPLMGRILEQPFGSPPDPAFWDRESPITIARTANLSGLAIYFDCGAEDDLGLDAGNRALDRVLTARHIPHEFHLYPGGHNWEYFAAHLPASLEFESRAMGASGDR
ncbi:MAG: alpha/beta hydrolase family protein [Candidatus Acidiferrales bacterium]